MLLFFAALAIASADAAAEAPAPAETPPDPRVVVPALRGVELKKGAPAHKALVVELGKRIGDRVVPVADVLKAQAGLGVTADDLATVEGVARLAAAVSAERAVVVTVDDDVTRVEVYGTLEGAPPLLLELPRKKKDPLDGKWAAATADDVARRAKDTLAFRVDAPLMDLSEPEPAVVAPAPKPAAKPAGIAPAPFVFGGVGFGVAGRSVDVSGPLASRIAPMDLGASPSLSAYVGFAPLRLVDSHRDERGAWWNDGLVELAARRGLIDARVDGGGTCNVDDDDVTVAASWRARLSDEVYVPRVGGGVSAGVERFVISGCDVPALSTTSTQLALFGRVAEAIVPGVVEADLVAGGRVPVVVGASGFERPGGLLQLAVNVTPLRYVFVRGVGRVFESRLTQGKDLVVGDTRFSFELQLGGAL